MKPAKFEYLLPLNLQEALAYLDEYGEDAKIMSGGQSLIPVLNMRLSTPKYIIDLGKVEELKYILEEDEQIRIGALTRHADVERSELVHQHCGILVEAMKWVGHTHIRNRGTMGGTIAHADPSAEMPCVVTALRGEIVIASKEEERVVSPEEFYLTYLLTSLEPTEMVKEVRFPVLSSTSGFAFTELARRHGDFALVAVAAVIDLDAAGKISSCRLVVGGAGPVPAIIEDAEDELIGEEPTEEAFIQALKHIEDDLDPEDDLHGTGEYRIELARTLCKRALITASNRAQGVVSL